MAKTIANMDDDELIAAWQEEMAERARDEEKHRERQLAFRAEHDRRAARRRAEDLKRQLEDLPDEIRAEVIGG